VALCYRNFRDFWHFKLTPSLRVVDKKFSGAAYVAKGNRTWLVFALCSSFSTSLCVSLLACSGLSILFAASGIFVIPHQLVYHHLNALLLSHSSRLQHHIFIGHRMIFTKNLSSANSWPISMPHKQLWVNIMRLRSSIVLPDWYFIWRKHFAGAVKRIVHFTYSLFPLIIKHSKFIITTQVILRRLPLKETLQSSLHRWSYALTRRKTSFLLSAFLFPEACPGETQWRRIKLIISNFKFPIASPTHQLLTHNS
jgi:hypothetical protein